MPTASKPLIYLCFLRSYNYTRTIQERPPFGAVFCGIKQCALALGFFLERCRRQRKREKKGAAVEILRRSTAEFREPQGAAMPKMPGVRITSLRPYRKDRLSGRSFAALSNVRLLWAFSRALPEAENSSPCVFPYLPHR